MKSITAKKPGFALATILILLSVALFGAGAVVTKDVPPYAIVTGVPAAIQRYKNIEPKYPSSQEVWSQHGR